MFAVQQSLIPQSDKLLSTCTSCVLFMHFVFFLFHLFLAISQNITQIMYTLAYGQHAKWVWCYESTVTTNVWTIMNLHSIIISTWHDNGNKPVQDSCTNVCPRVLCVCHQRTVYKVHQSWVCLDLSHSPP
jgi:hypothetical protein